MKKSDLYGIVGSAITCGIILLLLLLITLPRFERPQEEGIIVSFGESHFGGGQNPPALFDTPRPQVQEQTPQQVPTPPQPDIEDPVLTQIADNTLEIARQEEERRRREEEAERRRREEEERRLAEERRLEEQRRQEAADRLIADAFRQQPGMGDATAGSGIDTGDEQRGNPAGRGVSDGNPWSLDGRDIIAGTLVRPVVAGNPQGVIVVNIRVDERGHVVGASINDGLSSIPITNPDTRRAVVNAAMQTRFTTGRTVATGTITYNFTAY